MRLQIKMNENEKLKKIRQKLCLTQQEMADKLEVSKQYWSKVENGLTELSKDKVKMLCGIFRISSDWLLQDKGQMFIDDQRDIDSLENFDNFNLMLNCLTIYRSYSIALYNLIKEEYPNASINDILTVSYRILLEKIKHKTLDFSARKEIEQEWVDKVKECKGLKDEILNLYFRSYFERAEKPQKELD